MALGLSLIFEAVLSGLIVVLALLWIVRSIRTGEFGLFAPSIAPAIRRVREPAKFWLALGLVTIFLVILPVLYVLTIPWSF